MLAVIDLAGEVANLGGPWMLAALAAFGFAVGVLTGLFGVGGGFVLTPMLIVLFGIEESAAVGAGLCFIIGTSAAGVARHWRMRSVEPRSMLAIGVGSIGGAVLGTIAHAQIKASMGDGTGFAITMRTIYLVLLPLAGYLAFHGGRRRTQYTLMQRLPLPPRIALPAAGLAGISLPGLCLLGLAVGLVTGAIGVGGGVLYVPLLLSAVGLSAHQAIGTSLGAVLISSMAATGMYAAGGHVNITAPMALLMGSTIGVVLGTRWCHRLQAPVLRRGFAVVVLTIMVLLAADLALKLIAPWRSSPAAAPAQKVTSNAPSSGQRDHGQIQRQIPASD